MANTPEFNWNGDQILKQIEEAAMEGLAVWGEVTLTEAKKRVPQDTGTLRRSGTVSFEVPDADNIYEQAKTSESHDHPGDPTKKEMYLSFNTPYAFKMHEDLSLQHLNGGQAKFLESAINDKRKDAERIVASEITKRVN